MDAGLIDVNAAYLQENRYPYKVTMVKSAQEIMTWTPGTVLVVLEPTEKEGPPTGSQAQLGGGK